MARYIHVKDMPRVMRVSAYGIKRSMANALNDLAFKSLKPLVNEAEGDMKFRRNARRALGWRVNKATPANGRAEVWTDRGWFGFHSQKGNRRPSGDFRIDGIPMILIPKARGEGVVSKTGRIRKNAWKNIYFIPQGDKSLVFYRARRGAKQSEYVGIAVRAAKFNKDTDWDGVMDRMFARYATEFLRKRLDDRAAYEAR